MFTIYSGALLCAFLMSQKHILYTFLKVALWFGEEILILSFYMYNIVEVITQTQICGVFSP